MGVMRPDPWEADPSDILEPARIKQVKFLRLYSAINLMMCTTVFVAGNVHKTPNAPLNFMLTMFMVVDAVGMQHSNEALLQHDNAAEQFPHIVAYRTQISQPQD